MPDGLEITQKVIEDFIKVQKNMMLVKEENESKTYASLKEDIDGFIFDTFYRFQAF